jgi:starch-binding outer membrane protein SusE/F
MKYLSKFILVILLAAGFASCDKTDSLPSYTTGNKIILAASGTLLAPIPADSNKVAITLSWTDPHYNTAAANIKYVVEIDTAGGAFTRPYITKVVSGGENLSTTFTGKDINSVLVSRGYAFNVPVSLDVRVSSSYTNNNDRYTSDVIRLKFTPYKVPPKIALPTTSRLFLVGDASAGGWNNPVPVPSQEFARLDETTWAGIFNLTGGKEYLVLPLNGDWGNKFSVANKSLAGLWQGGDFGFNLSDNFPGPPTSGLYKIVLDFQSGKFAVTPYTSVLPTNLFIVGDATPGGWNNPVPVPSQQLTRVNSSVWEITLNFIGGKEYLLLPVNGDWSHKYSVPNKGLAGLWQGGEFGYDLPDNFPGPPTSGSYKLTVNFAAPTTAANRSGRFTVQ